MDFRGRAGNVGIIKITRLAKSRRAGPVSEVNGWSSNRDVKRLSSSLRGRIIRRRQSWSAWRVAGGLTAARARKRERLRELVSVSGSKATVVGVTLRTPDRYTYTLTSTLCVAPGRERVSLGRSAAQCQCKRINSRGLLRVCLAARAVEVSARSREKSALWSKAKELSKRERERESPSSGH